MCDKALKIAKNPKYDGYRRDLASVVYKVFDKKPSAKFPNKFTGSGMKNKNISNKELADKLHKSIIIKSKKEKYTHLFIDNVLGPGVTDMQLMSKFNK